MQIEIAPALDKSWECNMQELIDKIAALEHNSRITGEFGEYLRGKVHEVIEGACVEPFESGYKLAVITIAAKFLDMYLGENES